ncbi:hypothetical protein TWF192_008965 [Orbilia oligospora]|uniref:F-box domain-containing protein n=1 Tax=Orbilia oligospora TaxID=2813651 RepID=A0A6G1MJB1_ORBOL|nr:hypothetical protein TWF191_010619 [Orbilia oligospora]KAF3261032.1 hypothetical protein TWF192_008965 [Orbilia oligospora]
MDHSKKLRKSPEQADSSVAPEIKDWQAPARIQSESEEPQSTPPMASESHTEPLLKSPQIEEKPSSPTFIDTTLIRSEYSIDAEAPPRGLSFRDKLKWVQETQPTEDLKKEAAKSPGQPSPKSPASTIPSPANSEYSVGDQTVPQGLTLKDRLQWAKSNPSNAERKKRKRSSSPVPQRSPPPQPSPDPKWYQQAQDDMLHREPNSPEHPASLSFSEAMYAPLRANRNTRTDSGRTTPHMLRIPPEEPPYVRLEDDDTPVKIKQHSSPQWTHPESPEERPVSPVPFTIYVDEPTPTPRKRKRESIEDVVEGGEGESSPESPVGEETEVPKPLGHGLPVIIHTEDPSPRPRKRYRGVTPSLSDCSSPPTPIFCPSPADRETEEERDEERKETEEKEDGTNPAIVQSDAQGSLAIVQSNPYPSRPRTYGEIRSRRSVIAQSSSHSEALESTGSVSGKPAIVLSDTRPQQEGVLGEYVAREVRVTPPPVIEDSPRPKSEPSRGRSACPTPRRLPWPKRHILDLPPYITAERNTDEALRRRRLGTSFGRRLLGAKAQEGVPKSSSTEGERKPSSILKLFEIPELFARISNKLSEKDCLNLTSTCKALREKKEQVWDINAHMAHFLQRPTEFRSLMATHGAVVSGSDALQFLSRERFENSDLDVYVEVGGLRGFKKHLEEVEGYRWVPYEWQSGDIEEAIVDRILDTKDFQKLEQAGRLSEGSKLGYLARYEMKTLEGVFFFQKGKAEDQSLRQVQLIVTHGPPMYAILSDFYATHLFNVYDYKGAYSLFPQGTFVERRGYKTQAMTAKVVRCCGKYVQRGYDILDYTEWDEKSTEEGKFGDVVLKVKDDREIRRSRRVGDRFSWCLNLDTTGVDVPEHPPSSLLEYATFGMGYNDKRRNMYGEVREAVTPYMKVQCAPMRSELVAGDLVVDTLGGEWEEFLSETLRMAMRRGTQVGYRADMPLWYDMFQARRGEVEGLRKEAKEAKGVLRRVKERLRSVLWGWGL